MRAVLDGFLIAAAYFFALGLRMLDPGIVQERRFLFTQLAITPLILLIHLASAFGIYRTEAASIRALAQASVIAVGVLLALVLLGRQLDVLVPISTFLLGGVLSILGMVLLRYFARHLVRR